MTKRRPPCGHRIHQDRFSVYCRRGRGHEGDHAYWTSAGRVEWNTAGMVLAESGMRVWRPGKLYRTGWQAGSG